MKRASLFFRATIATYVAAWFLPVIKDGTTLRKGGLPGWEALRFSLSPIWDPQAREKIWDVTIMPLSGLSNLWLLAVVAVLVGKLRMSPRTALRGSALATLLNLQWMMRVQPLTDLYIGYYLWLASFALLTWTVRTASRD